MPKSYTVQSGDCLATIAAEHGFGSTAKLVDANADLLKRRSSDLLFPGDVVTIPDLTPKSLVLATGQKHRIVIQRPMKKLKLRLLDTGGVPFKQAACKLSVAGGKSYAGTTDGDGTVVFEIPAIVKEAKLEVSASQWTLRIGGLNPMRGDGVGEDRSGVKSRLSNLGYCPADVDDDGLRGAVEQFQRDNDLTADGQVTVSLIDHLSRAYGC